MHFPLGAARFPPRNRLVSPESSLFLNGGLWEEPSGVTGRVPRGEDRQTSGPRCSGCGSRFGSGKSP